MNKNRQSKHIKTEKHLEKVVGKREREKKNKTSVNGFNLSKIESRPVKSNRWEYLFYVDIEGSLLCEKTKKHLESISYLFDYVRVIGNY